MVRQPKTARGRLSRDQILGAAATLFHERGVHATSVDDVLAASATGKSQFYHHFSGKAELVREVLAYQFQRLQDEQGPLLERLDSWEGIEAWFAYIVDWQGRRRLLGGCPIGSMAAEMADGDNALRAELAEAFRHWESLLARGFSAMRDRGELRPEADPDVLAEVTLAAIQGGILLARTKQNVRSLEQILQEVLVYLRGFAPVPVNGRRKHGGAATKLEASASRPRRAARAT
jgi:AcrR family transcriptional regulator